MSGRHAVISIRIGAFYIEDTSINGVSINSLDHRLIEGRLYALKDGDVIFIGPFQIDVRIELDAARRRSSQTAISSRRASRGGGPGREDARRLP